MTIDHLKVEKDGLIYRTNFKNSETKEEINLEAHDLKSMIEQVQEILQLSPLTSVNEKPISKYLQVKENFENNPETPGYINYKNVGSH